MAIIYHESGMPGAVEAPLPDASLQPERSRGSKRGLVAGAAAGLAVLGVSAAAALGLTHSGSDKGEEIHTDNTEATTPNNQPSHATDQSPNQQAENSLLYDLKFGDDLTALDPNLVGNFYLGEMNRFFRSHNTQDLKRFGTVATGDAQITQQTENPISMKATPDAEWGWFHDPADTDDTNDLVLVKGSVAYAHGATKDLPAGTLTIDSEKLALKVRWIPDGKDDFIGSHQILTTGSYSDENPDAEPLSPGAENQTAQTTTTSEQATETTGVPDEVLMGLAHQPVGTKTVDHNGYIWRLGADGEPHNLGQEGTEGGD